MAQNKTLKLLIQRYTETNANGQLTMTDLVNWGAETLSSKTDLITEEYLKKTSNLPITFQEIEVNDEPTPFEKMFNNAVSELTNQMKRIMTTKTLIMTVGGMQETKIELTPKEGGFDGWDFRLDGPTYYRSKDKNWYPLGTGDEIEVSLNPFNFSHGCQVKCTVQRVVERHNPFYKKYHESQQLNRMNKDFTCMAGHAVIYGEYLETLINGSFCNAIFLFHGLRPWSQVNVTEYPSDILSPLYPRSVHRLYISSYKSKKTQKDNYSLNMCIIKELSPKDEKKRSFSDVGATELVGTIYQLTGPEKPNMLHTQHQSGNEYYYDGCFRKKKNGQLWYDMNVYGPLIRDYLPLGFPATFTLISISEKESSLRLRGLLPGLHGRMSSDQEARDAMASIAKPVNQGKKKKKKKNTVTELSPIITSRKWRLCANMLMTPYQLIDQELLFTSAAYAGHAERNSVPSGRIIFTSILLS